MQTSRGPFDPMRPIFVMVRSSQGETWVNLNNIAMFYPIEQPERAPQTGTEETAPPTARLGSVVLTTGQRCIVEGPQYERLAAFLREQTDAIHSEAEHPPADPGHNG